MRRVYTTQEAAHALGVSELTVKKWSQQGLIRYEGKRGRRNLYNAADVVALSVQRRAGDPDRKLRQAIIVDRRGDILEEERRALEVSGITVTPAESVHHAMSMVEVPYKPTTRPIVIAPTIMDETEHRLLALYTREAHIILVGSDRLIPKGAYAALVRGGDCGALVRLVWKYVYEKRAYIAAKGANLPAGVRGGAL